LDFHEQITDIVMININRHSDIPNDSANVKSLSNFECQGAVRGGGSTHARIDKRRNGERRSIKRDLSLHNGREKGQQPQ